MKNLLIVFAFGALTLISCQSEPKATASAETPKAAASIPASTPASAPAPIAAAPEAKMDMDKKAVADEAPAMPTKTATAPKSVKNMETPADPAPMKVTKPNKVKEVITENKSEMEAKMAAEAAKAKAETERIAAETKRIAAEKAANMKAKATETVKNPINKTKEKVEEVKEIKEEMAFSHKAFDGLLRKYVSSAGKVNYSGFKKDQAKLNGYLKQLEGQPVESSWSNNKKLAYWINAYNAYTVDLIINNYPIKSITDLEGGKPWDKKFIKLNGKTLSLNDIENVIIRPTFKDARIHFAVNCAAKSCPPLMNKAWTSSNLQSELEKRTKAFINDSSYNTISSGSATISKIFEWYAVDFGNLNDYLAKYSAVNGSTKISYSEYDWSLNE